MNAVDISGALAFILQLFLSATTASLITYFAMRRLRNSQASQNEAAAKAVSTSADIEHDRSEIDITEKIRQTTVALLETQQQQINVLNVQLKASLGRITLLEKERFEINQKYSDLKITHEQLRHDYEVAKVELDEVKLKNEELQRRIAELESRK